MEYLEAEKRSSVTANDVTLMNIYKNLKYISDNDLEKQSTIVELKILKKESLSNIFLFNSKIESTKGKLELTPRSKANDVNEALDNLKSDVPQYWCAVRSYINATVLEAILAEMDDPIYLDDIKKDLMEKVNQYNISCKSANNKIGEFIEEAKALNRKKKLPNTVKDVIMFAPSFNVVGAGVKALAFGAAEIDTYIENDARKKKEKAIQKRDDFWSACMNLNPLEETAQLIEEYKINRNSPVELIFVNFQ